MNEIIQTKHDMYHDDRGVIETILKGGRLIDSVLKITSFKGTRRANHYHKTSGHYCVLTTGSLSYYERPVGSKEKPVRIAIGVGEVFWTGAMTEHLMVFEEESVLWCFSTGSRAQSDYEEDLVRLDVNLDEA